MTLADKLRGAIDDVVYKRHREWSGWLGHDKLKLRDTVWCEVLDTIKPLQKERDELAAEILKFQLRCAGCGRLSLDHQPCGQCRAALKRVEEGK